MRKEQLGKGICCTQMTNQRRSNELNKNNAKGWKLRQRPKLTQRQSCRLCVIRLEAILKENVELQGYMSQMREELDALKLKSQPSTVEKTTAPTEKPQYQFKKPTEFSGEGKSDIRAWLRGLDRYLDGTKCPEKERLAVAVYTLRARHVNCGTIGSSSSR
jgi:hypothetical protein